MSHSTSDMSSRRHTLRTRKTRLIAQFGQSDFSITPEQIEALRGDFNATRSTRVAATKRDLA